ncbi:unnamed protein product [Symbiodinium sp. CCMP2592]|nr:unnamed protein product [Symbiodinium sp. CCMP2592]
MNSDFLERSLSNLAAEVLCSSRLHQPPDIIGIADEAGHRGEQPLVLSIGFRRSFLDEEVLKEQATAESRSDLLKAAENEYKLIREIEATASGASVLKQHALHTTFQVYREIMATMQMHNFKDCQAIADMVQAWFPRWGQSANLEQIFREMEQATKRVGHVENSMPNLTCVAVRAMSRRVCCGDECPATPTLSEKDWEGQVVRNLKDKMWHPTSAPPCKNVRIDDILKPFTTMSAYSQTHHNFNCVLGWKEAKRTGTSPIDSMSSMWAVRLKEIVWSFKGPLPAETVDERRMPASTHKATETRELFDGEADSTRALSMDSGSMFTHRLCGLHVEIFCYTLHVCPTSMESKCGGILFRRGPKPYSLLVHLFVSENIMSITSAALSDILTAYSIRMPKNSSKHAKITKLMTLDEVKQAIGDAGVARMEAKLLEIDKNRHSKKKAAEAEGDDVTMHDETAAEKANDEDPAVAACCQLLEELGDESEAEAEEKKEEKKEEASEEQTTPAETTRASKALLSKTQTVPQWLLDKFPIPTGGWMHHTQFRDSSLPLFQAKLQNGKIFEGQRQSCSLSVLRFLDSYRNSVSASYNPDLNVEQLNERITLAKTMPARERSMSQAYFFAWSWLNRALNPVRLGDKRKRKRTEA